MEQRQVTTFFIIRPRHLHRRLIHTHEAAQGRDGNQVGAPYLSPPCKLKNAVLFLVTEITGRRPGLRRDFVFVVFALHLDLR